MKAEDYYVGIDIGTSNSCSGLFLNGKVKIIPNKMGERITPSVVLLQNNQKYYVGEEALCESVGSDKNFISEIKRFIGLSYDEFIELGFDKSINYKHLIKNINGLPTIEIENNGEKSHFTAEDITYMIIKKMIKSTEDFIAEIKEGTKLTSAILTVPAQFTDNQKNAVFNAAKRAGLKIPRIINEPTAAALAYGFGHNLISKLNRKDKLINSSIRGDEYELSFSSNKYVGEKDQKKKLMIFDLGGGTFDISILNLKINQSTSDFEVLLTDGDIHLGGSDFDQALIDYCVETFCERMMINKHDLLKDFNAMRKLKIKCEKDKKMLGEKKSVNITIENFYDNKDLTINIKQKEFIDICKDKYEKIKVKIYSVLSELDITKDDIDNVILVGGGSKIHGIKELLINIFGENKIRDDINPEEAVAIGATLYAVKTQGNQKMNFNLQDIIPFNIGIGVKNQDKEEAKYGDKMHVIIPKYTKFPGETYQKKYEVNLTERHPDIIVNVFEGNNKYVNNNKKIGEFNKKNLNRKGEIIKINENRKKYIYKGNIKNFKKDGDGTEKTNEFFYEGQFLNDIKHGQGKIIFYNNTSESYEGEFKNGEITGKGFYIWKNKHTYLGEFYCGKMHGKGLYKWPDGNVYEGDYIYGVKEGYGEFIWADGRIYKGPFKNGKQHGNGKLTVNGTTFDAVFENGKYMGELRDSNDKKKNKEKIKHG